LDTTPGNVYRTRVRSYMTDLNGVMFHSTYFHVFDDARIEVFRSLGYTYQWMLSHGWTLVIRHVECDFRAPAHQDDVLYITVRIEKFTAATMRVRYDCRREEVDLAVGAIVYAMLDVGGRPVRVPADMRKAVEAHPEMLMNQMEPMAGLEPAT
jgi:acyl-CoA thioester hydrolase